MMPDRQLRRRLLRYGNGVAALAASALLLGLLGAAHATIPALGPALVPGHGAWTCAAGAQLPGNSPLAVAGLTAPVQVWFTRQGIPSISALQGRSDGSCGHDH